MATLRYYVCDLMTGVILGELPLAAHDAITTVIGREDSYTFTLPTADPQCPDEWYQILEPGQVMIILTIDDEPAQAWVVDDAPIGETTVQIECTTLEECLRRTNVPDLDQVSMDSGEAAYVLCAPLVTRFGFYLEHTATGHRGDMVYSSTEDRSILDVLGELRAGDGGPEWRILVRWTDPNLKTGVDKVVQIAAKIGAPRPEAKFDLDSAGNGTIVSYLRGRSYAQGKGASMLIGVSDGASTARVMTDPIYSDRVASGFPVWEERVSFSGLDGESVEDEDAELLRRTKAKLAQREKGAITWTIVGRPDGPQPGADFTHGDTVFIDIAPQGKKDPVGGTGEMRVLGWTLDPRSGQVALIAWEDEDS